MKDHASRFAHGRCPASAGLGLQGQDLNLAHHAQFAQTLRVQITGPGQGIGLLAVHGGHLQRGSVTENLAEGSSGY